MLLLSVSKSSKTYQCCLACVHHRSLALHAKVKVGNYGSATEVEMVPMYAIMSLLVTFASLTDLTFDRSSLGFSKVL